MNRQFFNYIFLPILFLGSLAFNAGAQSIQAEAKLQDYTIKIGDQTKLFLIIHQPAKEHVNFPKIADTITGKVQVINAGKPDTAVDKTNNSLTVTHAYTITSFDAGTYTIPEFSFGTPSAGVKTSELTLQVQTVKVDTTKAIYDIKQPLVVTYTFFDWLKDNWIWVVLGLVVIALVVGLIWYLKKRPKPIPIIKKALPVIPPHTLALNKLQELRDKKLWQQEQVKEYHSELSDILRDYLEKRYTVKTQEKTTDEILSGLKYVDITEDNKNKLRQILVLADLVKFAKERPLPIDNEQSMDNVIALILNTQQAATLVQNSEGGSGNEPV